MFVPLGASDFSGFYFKYPDNWKEEDMNVQTMRKSDPYMKIEDLSIVYDGGNILSSGLSSNQDNQDTQTSSVSSLVSCDTLFLYHGTKDDGLSKPVLRVGEFSRKLILQTIDGINALDKIEQTYAHPDEIQNFLSDSLNVADLQTSDDRIKALSSVRLFRPGLCNYVKSLPAVVNDKMTQWAYMPKEIDIGTLYAPMVQSLLDDIKIDDPIYYTNSDELQYLGDTLSSLKDINNMPKWPYNRAVDDSAERHSDVEPKYWCRNERKFALAVADKLGLSQETKDAILSAENPWLEDLSSGGNPPILDLMVENYTPDPYNFVQQKWDMMSYPKKSLLSPILAQSLLMSPYICGLTFKDNSITVPHVRQTHRHEFQLIIDLTKIEIQDQYPFYQYEEYPVKSDAMQGNQLAYENIIFKNLVEYDKIDNKFTQANSHYGDLNVVRLHYGTVDINALIDEGHDLDDDNCVYFSWDELNDHNSNIYRAFARSGGSTTSEIRYNFEWELKQKLEGELSGTYGGRWPSKVIGDNIETLNVSLIQNSHIQGFDEESKSTECLSKMDDTVTLSESNTWSGSLTNLQDVVGKFKQPLDNEYWSYANDWYTNNQIDFQWPISLNEKEEAEIDYASAYDSKITLSWQSGLNIINSRCHVTQFDDNGKPLLWDVQCWDWSSRSWIKCLDEFEPIVYENWTLKLPEDTPQAVIAGDGSDPQCFKSVDAEYKTDLQMVGEFVFK